MVAQFQLTSIQKCFGTKIALELDSLILWPNNLYILTGSNGSGKSTLLGILAFLMKPEKGQVMFAGEPVAWKQNELTHLRKKVTLLHQTPYLFTGTVFGNIAFGLKIRGLSGEKLRQRVAESLAMVGLEGFEERKIGELSGGETRRIALARSLALRPEILLLDEPLANVDKETTDVIERLIVSLPAQGTTVVMSTHDLHQSERLGSKVIRLMNGRVQAESAPSSASCSSLAPVLESC